MDSQWVRSFNPKRAVIYFVAASVLLIAVLPRASLVTALVTMGVWAGFISSVLCALTFWPKARVRIGRLRLRYKLVRRNAGWVAVIGFSFLLMQAISLGVRNTPQPELSSADSASNAAAIDPEQAVVRCFCDTLSAQRKSQARENLGVAYSDWPLPFRVDACVERLARVDEKQAEEVWLKQRSKALEGDDGGAICQVAGMPVYDGEPPPVGPEIMQGAHEEFCRMLVEPHDPAPDYDPKHPGEASREAIVERERRWQAADDAEFAARFHISVEQANAALERAAAEHNLPDQPFLCPGEEPRPTNAELDAPPTEAEVASVRSAFCQAARENPDKLIGELYERAQAIYEASSSTKLGRYRALRVVEKAGDELQHDGLQRGELLHGEQVTQNYCK
jgi:hypothetical protein